MNSLKTKTLNWTFATLTLNFRLIRSTSSCRKTPQQTIQAHTVVLNLRAPEKCKHTNTAASNLTVPNKAVHHRTTHIRGGFLLTTYPLTVITRQFASLEAADIALDVIASPRWRHCWRWSASALPSTSLWALSCGRESRGVESAAVWTNGRISAQVVCTPIIIRCCCRSGSHAASRMS